MQLDFEKWLSVMLKQYNGGNDTGTSPANTSSVNNFLDSSQSSRTGMTQLTRTTDRKVNENLESFYKARDDIYKVINKN